MIRHINIAVQKVLELKEKEPAKYQKLIDEGIMIGLGVDFDGRNNEITTASKIMENNRPKDPAYSAIAEAVVEGNRESVEKLTANLLGQGKDPTELVLKALMPGIQTVCELYDIGEAFVPEILMSNDALQGGVKLCQGELGDVPSQGKVISLVIEGDLHDIGKNIVKAILSSNGYEVIDLGRDVPVEAVVETVKVQKPDLVTGTTLMSTTKGGLKALAEALESEGVPVACGGAAVDKHFVETFSNSIYGRTPLDAVKIANKICEEKSWQEVRKELH